MIAINIFALSVESLFSDWCFALGHFFLGCCCCCVPLWLSCSRVLLFTTIRTISGAHWKNRISNANKYSLQDYKRMAKNKTYEDMGNTTKNLWRKKYVCAHNNEKSISKGNDNDSVLCLLLRSLFHEPERMKWIWNGKLFFSTSLFLLFLPFNSIGAGVCKRILAPKTKKTLKIYQWISCFDENAMPFLSPALFYSTFVVYLRRLSKYRNL